VCVCNLSKPSIVNRIFFFLSWFCRPVSSMFDYRWEDSSWWLADVKIVNETHETNWSRGPGAYPPPTDLKWTGNPFINHQMARVCSGVCWNFHGFWFPQDWRSVGSQTGCVPKCLSNGHVGSDYVITGWNAMGYSSRWLECFCSNRIIGFQKCTSFQTTKYQLHPALFTINS
jgi:hypothetical protein